MLQCGVKHLRILVVDDSPAFVRTLCAFLENCPNCPNVKIVGLADNASQALVTIGELQPDLVLMDLQMAGMNGLEATSEIRHRFPGMAVVIVTSHEVPGLERVCHESGACGFVKKSRLYEDLPDVLARFLISQRRGERHLRHPAKRVIDKKM